MGSFVAFTAVMREISECLGWELVFLAFTMQANLDCTRPTGFYYSCCFRNRWLHEKNNNKMDEEICSHFKPFVHVSCWSNFCIIAVHAMCVPLENYLMCSSAACRLRAHRKFAECRLKIVLALHEVIAKSCMIFVSKMPLVREHSSLPMLWLATYQTPSSAGVAWSKVWSKVSISLLFTLHVPKYCPKWW